MKRLLFSILVFWMILPAGAQDFKDQLTMMRPRPENCIIYGPISIDKNTLITDAAVSLLDPVTHEILEKIVSDRNAWYLFSVKKGQKLALLVEKNGLFPYYHEFTIPGDYPEASLEKPLNLPSDLQYTYALYFVPFDTVLGQKSQLLMNRLAGILAKNPEIIVRFDSMGDSLDPARINQLTSYYMDQGIPSSRLTSGASDDTLPTALVIEIRTGPEDLAGTASPDTQVLTDEMWTIQISASRSSLNKKAFKGLDPVHEFKGKDGFYRYTYGIFQTREEAVQKLPVVKKKGFTKAFAKSAGSIRKL
jgi:hypothetical protein